MQVKKIKLYANGPRTFYRKLQLYIDSTIEQTIRKAKLSKILAKETENNLAPDYWPLIKVVKIFLKSKILKDGAVLVDLPGIKDSNAARSAVSERYLMKCNSIWVVSPIHRATNDESARALLGKFYSQDQLFMDGTFQTATFICSKSDVLGRLEDAVEDLGLEREGSWFFRRIAAEQKRAGSLKQEIRKARDHISKLENQIEPLKRNKTTIYNTVLQRYGVTTSNSNNGTQSNTSISNQEIAQGSIDDDAASGTEGSQSSDFSRQVSPIRQTQSSFNLPGGAKLTTNTNCKIPSSLPTLTQVESIMQKIKATISNLKAQILAANDVVAQKEKALEEIPDRITAMRQKLEDICITRRNDLAKEAVRKIFTHQMSLMERKTSLTSTPESSGMAGRDLPVFCISATSFQEARKNAKSNSTSSPEFASTGIIDLQEHCRKSTIGQMQACALRFLSALEQFLNSVSRWSVGYSGALGNKQDPEVVNDTISNLLETFWHVIFPLLLSLC